MTDGGNNLTMTPEIAARILEGTTEYRPHPAHVEDAKLFAARVLRSVATVSADAEKEFDAWWKEYWDEYFNEAGAKHIYLAGHAAGCAAKQSEVDGLRRSLR